LCRRLLEGEYAQDKIAAYQTLYTCLLTISKLGAYCSVLHGQTLQRLNSRTQTEKFDSVHLAEFPISVENYVNKMLESKMQKAQTISSLVLSLEKK
jgi:isoleucyl-tRNA synthetase